MPISIDDRIDLILKTQFGKLFTSSDLTLGQENSAPFTFERDQIFGQVIPNVYMTNIIWSDRENFDQIIEYGSKERILTGPNYLTQTYHATTNILLLYKLSFNTITDFSKTGLDYNIYTGRTIKDVTYSNNFKDYSGNYFDFKTINDTILKYIIFNSDHQYNRNAPSDLVIYGKNSDSARWNYLKQFTITHEDYLYDSRDVNANDLILDISSNEIPYKTYRISVGKILNDFTEEAIRITTESPDDILWTNETQTNWIDFPWTDYQTELEAIGLKIDDTDESYISNITDEPIWIRIDLNPQNFEPYQFTMTWKDLPDYIYVDPTPQQTQSTITTTTEIVNGINIFTNTFNYNNYNGNIQIVNEYYTTYVLTSNNELWTWGYNSNGEGGNGNSSSYNYPQVVPSSYFNNKKIVKVCRVCFYAGCALTNHGEVYAWGSGSYGAFLKGHTSGYSSPQLISWFTDNNVKIVDVTGGQYHWIALSDEGKVYTWGYNSHGQRGNGSAGNNYNNETSPFELSDFNDSNNGLYGKVVTHIKARQYHCMVVTSENSLYTWGESAEYSLGHSDNTSKYYPTKVDFDWGGTIVQIDASYRGCMVLTNNGTVYNWGTGNENGLGQNNTSDYYIPKIPIGLEEKIIVKIACSQYHSKYAVTHDGELWIWGNGYYYSLGNNTTGNQPLPLLHTYISNVTDIVPGYYTAYAVSDGKIYSWGYGYYGANTPESDTHNKYTPFEWAEETYFNNFKYEGSQIRSDYISLTGLKHFWKNNSPPDTYYEHFYSAAWNENPGNYDKIRGYKLPIVRQIGPKASPEDIWGAKLKLKNENSNSYHTSPNNYTNNEPWIKVTFLSNINGMIEKPITPLRNPHALMNSANEYCHYNGGTFNWQQDSATRLLEKNGVPGDLQNYWHLHFINLELFQNNNTASWIHPDATLLKEKEDTEYPENSLFNASNKTIYLEVSANDNQGLQNTQRYDQFDKKNFLPITIDWFGNPVWILYTMNELSNNTDVHSNDHIINTFPYIIELKPGEWITRMAAPEYYQVYTDIPELSWAVGKHYGWNRHEPRHSISSTFSWVQTNSSCWWRINIFNEDPRLYIETKKPYNLQTNHNYFNPSNNGSTHINDFKIFGREVYDINNVFNGETHYDYPNKVWGYGNNTTSIELLDASNVNLTIIRETIYDLVPTTEEKLLTNIKREIFLLENNDEVNEVVESITRVDLEDILMEENFQDQYGDMANANTDLPQVGHSANAWTNLLPNGWGINTYNDHIVGSFTEFNGWRIMQPKWFCTLPRANAGPFYWIDAALEETHAILSIESNYDAIISAITNGVYPINSNLNYNNNNISDGGADMYDGGNRIRTNLGGDFYYYEAINTSSYLAGNRYFTRLTVNKGLFIFVADLYDGGEGRTNNNTVSYIEIHGNLGADGGGSMTYGEYTSNYNGTAYKVYWKSVAGPGDPNVNHVWVVKDVPGLSRNLATHTDDDYHRLYIPTNGDVDRIYYFLWGAPTNNSVTNQTEVNSMLTKFFEVTGGVFGEDSIMPYPALGETANSYSYNQAFTEIKSGDNIIGFIGSNAINTNSIKVEHYLAPNLQVNDLVAICSMGDNINLSDPYNNSNTHSGLKTPIINIFNYYKNSLELEFQSNSMLGSNIRVNAIYDEDDNNKVVLLNKLVITSDLYKKYKIQLKNPMYSQTLRVEFECWGNTGYWIISDVKITNNQKYTDYKTQFISVIEKNLNLYTFSSSGSYPNSNYEEVKAFDGYNSGNYTIAGWLANYNTSQFGWDNNGYYNKQGIDYSYYTEDVSNNVYNGPWIEIEKETEDTIYYIEIYPTENTVYAEIEDNEGGRQPRDFRLYGSNNNLNHSSHNNLNECIHCNTDWHLIQEWTNISSQIYWDGDYKYFTGIIDNPSSYKKYRLAINRITTTQHNYQEPTNSGERLHIGQIKLYGQEEVYNNILTYISPETQQISEIKIDTNNQSKVYYIKIYPTNIERGYDSPSDFNLLASDDNINWTIIQEWSGIQAHEYYNGTKYSPYIGTLNIPTTYKYWKLQITKSTGFKMQIKQFELYGSEINLSKYIAGLTLSTESYNTADDSVDNRIGEEKRDLTQTGFLLGGNWEKLGEAILHTPYNYNPGDNWGNSSAISGDGTTIIAGAPYHDPNNNSNRGMIKVYKWDGNNWIQKGNDIIGTYNNEYLGGVWGRACSISYDGDRIAYGGYNYNSYQGRVYVSEWNGNSWVQQTVQYGDSNDEHYGRSVSLSHDGTVLAIAAPWDDDRGSNDGRVEIFKNTTGITWESWGSIYGADYEGLGEDLHENFGWGEGGGIQLSGDGTKLIVGCQNGEDPLQTSTSNEGAVVVIQINGNNDFTKIGKTIFKPGEYPIINSNSTDYFGYSVAMSYDGIVIAVATKNDDYDDEGTQYSERGSITVFKWSGTEWTKKGQKITGYTSNIYCHAVSLSNDGNIVAGSFPYADTNGSDTGYIHVLMYNSTTDRWDTMGTYQDIEGSDSNDENFIGFSGSLSISADGGRIVYGTFDYDLQENGSYTSDTGIVRVYEYKGGNKYDTVDPNEDLDDKTGLLTGPGSITRGTTITYESSSEYYDVYAAFTGISLDETEWGMGWISEGNCYGGGGLYTKEEKMETNEYYGEWIQINFNEQYVGTKIKLYQKENNISRSPAEFAIFASNDGINWSLIKEWFKKKEDWVENNYILSLDLSPNIKLYKKWRLVINKTVEYSNATPLGSSSLSQLELYGYKQQYFNLQNYVYSGVNTIEEAFELYGTEITQSTFNIEPYKLIFDLSKNLINFYNLSNSEIEQFTTLKNEKVISYNKNYNTTELKVTGSYYTNESISQLFKHKYKFANPEISIDYLFNDKLTNTNLNLEFENNLYNGNNYTNNYDGDWIEVDTKIPIKVTELKLYLNETPLNENKIVDMPKNYRLFASNEGDEWIETGEIVIIEEDINEENISNYLPIQINNNKIEIPGYITFQGILYKGKEVTSNEIKQLFEWNKNNLKLVPLSKTMTSTSLGNIDNLDYEFDPYLISDYGNHPSYVWESGDNYNSMGTYLISNPELTYEHTKGEMLQVDLGESKSLGFMTLRPICGDNKLLNPGPGSEITIYGSNNYELWIEVKKLENIDWGTANVNNILDYKLIEINETVSFRYWKLLFNKPSGSPYIPESIIPTTIIKTEVIIPATWTMTNNGIIDTNAKLYDVEIGDYIWMYLLDGTLVAKMEVYYDDEFFEFPYGVVFLKAHSGTGFYGVRALTFENADQTSYQNTLKINFQELKVAVEFAGGVYPSVLPDDSTLSSYLNNNGLVGEVGWFLRTEEQPMTPSTTIIQKRSNAVIEITNNGIINTLEKFQEIQEEDYIYMYLADGTLVAKMEVTEVSSSLNNIALESHYALKNEGDGFRISLPLLKNAVENASGSWPYPWSTLLQNDMTYNLYTNNNGLGGGEVGWFLRTEEQVPKNDFIIPASGDGYETRVGLSEWKLYSPLSSLSNIISTDYIADLDNTDNTDKISVRTITKSIPITQDYYRYWRVVINEKHPGILNEIKLKQVEMRGLELKQDNNLLTLWRPEINRPLENYKLIESVSSQEVINWTLTGYNLTNVNLIYRVSKNEVFTNIYKTFDLELFKDIKEIFQNQTIEEEEEIENKYMDVNTIEMTSYIKSINTEEDSEEKYKYIKRYENVEFEKMRDMNNRAWVPKNNIIKEKLKKIIQGRTPFYFELETNIVGAEVINSWDSLYKPIVNNGLLIFLGEKAPANGVILKMKVFYTFEGYTAPNAIIRQLEYDPTYLEDEPYFFYNKLEGMNKLTTGKNKELKPAGYDAFVETFCQHPEKIKNIIEEVKYYEIKNEGGIVQSGWQKLPLELIYDVSANIEDIHELNDVIQDQDILLDVNTHKIYRYTGIWEEYYDLEDLSNNYTGLTAWTNATSDHWYKIKPYVFLDLSSNFPINGMNDGDIYIYLNDGNEGLYQYNNDLKERNVIYRWDSIINWKQPDIIITNFTGETHFSDPSGSSCIKEGNLIAVPIINRIKMNVLKNDEPLTELSNITIFTKGDNEIYRPDEFPRELKINLWTGSIEFNDQIYGNKCIRGGVFKIELWHENNSSSMVRNKNQIFVVIN